MAQHVTHSHQLEAPEHHGSGAYWLVWIALLVLTAITWQTGQMHIPGFSLLLALIIAVTKATLVVLFFMHLWEQKGVNRVAFVSSIVFVVVMLLGVFGDVTMRLNSLLPKREDPSAVPHGLQTRGAGEHGSGGAKQTEH
jgi:cytochrome c oxidase subunit IV